MITCEPHVGNKTLSIRALTNEKSMKVGFQFESTVKVGIALARVGTVGTVGPINMLEIGDNDAMAGHPVEFRVPELLDQKKYQRIAIWNSLILRSESVKPSD